VFHKEHPPAGVIHHRHGADSLTRYTELPSELAAALRAEAVETSDYVRRHRAIVHGLSVRLAASELRLVFGRLRRRRERLELPLAIEGAGVALDGALELEPTAAGPLPLLESSVSDPSYRGGLWILAIAAVADLTCPPRATPVSSMLPRTGGTDKAEASGNGTRRTLHQRADRRYSPLAPTLTPTDTTVAVLSSYVAGHRRRLLPGHHASSVATANADRVGIRLGTSETWVQPHIRGVPSDEVLEFHWRPRLVDETTVAKFRLG